MGAKRGFAMVLLVAALLVRAAIPQGYMVESTASRVLTVTICHSDKVWQIPLEKKEEREGRPHHGDPQPCVFGALGTAPAPSEAPQLALPPKAVEQFYHDEAPFALRNTVRQLPPARGPPAIA